jgi:DNA polymerase delta subunit 1
MEQTGRMTVDLMLYIKDAKKPKSNALKYAAIEWLTDMSFLTADPDAAWPPAADPPAPLLRDQPQLMAFIQRYRAAGGGGPGSKLRKDLAKLMSESVKASGAATPSAKIDLAAERQFQLYEEGFADPTKRWPIIVYCERDCAIPLLLIRTLRYLATWVALSQASSTPLQTICNGGQQARVFNCLATFVHGKRVLHKEDSGWPREAVNDADAADDDGKGALRGGSSARRKTAQYKGAMVLPPAAGYYPADEPVATLDFASLYPTIMRERNACPSALVIDEAHLPLLRACPWVMLETHTIEHMRADGTSFTKDYHIVMNEESITFQMLQMLVGRRAAVKRQMAAATDAALKAVYNALQDALKVICNSTYGFYGTDSETGKMSCKPLAASTTMVGQMYITATRDYIEATYPGARVLYGDTVNAAR